jgi:hypothetical protein
MRASLALYVAALAALVSVVAVMRLVRGRTASKSVDVGSVSDHWIAEHRVTQSDESIPPG